MRPTEDTVFVGLFLHISPQTWETEVRKLNEGIQKSNATTLQPINEFTLHEYFIIAAIEIGAACFFKKRYPTMG